MQKRAPHRINYLPVNGMRYIKYILELSVLSPLWGISQAQALAPGVLEFAALPVLDTSAEPAFQRVV